LTVDQGTFLQDRLHIHQKYFMNIEYSISGENLLEK